MYKYSPLLLQKSLKFTLPYRPKRTGSIKTELKVSDYNKSLRGRVAVL